MINHIDHIVEHLFHKKSLDDVSEFELERFIATYPYFGVGHFLLAKKTQIAKPENSKEKIAATSLYYDNALWLQWLIDQDWQSIGKNEEADAGILNYIPHDYQSSESNGSMISDESPESADRNDENLQADSQSTEINTHATTSNEGDSSTVENFSTTGDGGQIIDEEAYEFSERLFDSVHQETEIKKEEPLQPLDEDTAHPVPDDYELPEDNIAGVSTQSQETESEDLIDDNKSNDSGFVYGNEEVLPLEEDEIEHNSESQVSTEESRATAASIDRTLSSASLIPTKAAIEKNEITFEPYHTIDYFASQGIKLQQSDLSKDKFGKQLKSFTEWLRSMKRLPQPAIDANLDEATQASIQNIAEHSFEEKDIVTETMAEVWIKQGNKEKAIDTLEKLSLLNPSKSHYFAAKIEQLKAS